MRVQWPQLDMCLTGLLQALTEDEGARIKTVKPGATVVFKWEGMHNVYLFANLQVSFPPPLNPNRPLMDEH